MSMYIDVEEIIKSGPAKTSVFISQDYAYGYNYLLSELCKQKVEDVEPVRHGKWVYYDECSKWGFPYLCTSCGKAHDFEEKYCHNCGAKMDLED